MILDGSAASWPRSLFALPLAAVLFGLQAVPGLSVLMGLVRAEYWPGALLYAAAIGVGVEALFGRVSPAWWALPLGGALLSVMPRLLEERQIASERARIDERDQAGAGFGPGAGGVGVYVSEPGIARILALRYDVAFTLASPEIGLTDRILYRRVPGGEGRLTETMMRGQPENMIYMGGTGGSYSSGWISGYETGTTANWPDGRERSRSGLRLDRIGVPAFPIAGRGIGPGLVEVPFGVRWSRPGDQALGYSPPADPEAAAADIARLIGLAPLPRH
ncbi:MAG: hypothetical protein EOO77_12370 [Oxalobacteraceae bacterium]|nr:MAG: hypothetical protein EOO77_12370 [Oxalobacteraceae bacterium]